MQKHQLVEMDDMPVYQSAAFSQYVCSPHYFLLTWKSREYVCTLIVHSQEVDSRRTPYMIQEEEQAREYFEETRETLQLFCLSGWIKQFQQHVVNFIQARLAEAAKIIEKPEK